MFRKKWFKVIIPITIMLSGFILFCLLFINAFAEHAHNEHNYLQAERLNEYLNNYIEQTGDIDFKFGTSKSVKTVDEIIYHMENMDDLKMELSKEDFDLYKDELSIKRDFELREIPVLVYFKAKRGYIITINKKEKKVFVDIGKKNKLVFQN